MKKQKGFTLIELLICMGFIISVSGVVLLIYVAAHFISKLW